jgi:hypothetical protein
MPTTIASGRDIGQRRGLDLFCENLCTCLDDWLSASVVNWGRGYGPMGVIGVVHEMITSAESGMAGIPCMRVTEGS